MVQSYLSQKVVAPGREDTCCWILSHELLWVIEKCTVHTHESVYKISASCVGVSCLVPGGAMGVDVCADHLVYFDIWQELRQ